MTLGAHDHGDRVQNAPLLAGGGAAGGDGRFDALPGQPQLRGEDRDGAGVDARSLALTEPQDGEGAQAGLDAPDREPIGVQDRAQQVVQGLAVGHGAQGSAARSKKRATGLAPLKSLANIDEAEKCPARRPAYQGQTTDGAEPEPESRNMSTTTAPVPSLQDLLDATRPPAPLTGLGVGFGGIYATIDGGEVTHAIVEDAIAFAETFGAPVTHVRALEIAHLLEAGKHPLAAGWCEAQGAAIEEARAEFEADRAGE